MGYELAAIIGYETVLRSLSERFAEVRIAVLQEGLALIPVTTLLLGELEGNDDLPENIVFPKFPDDFPADHITRKLVAFIQEASGFGPLIYCEADYHGGTGGQLAVLWQAQKIILGPLCSRWGFFGQPYNKVKLEDLSINCALRRLGVRPQRGKDEFEIVGLHWKKHTEEWC